MKESTKLLEEKLHEAENDKEMSSDSEDYRYYEGFADALYFALNEIKPEMEKVYLDTFKKILDNADYLVENSQ